VKVEEESMTTRKVKSQNGKKYKEHSPTSSQQSIHATMFTEYENPTINGCMVLVVKSRGNKRIYIAEAILNLKTSVKLVEQKIEGLEEVMDVINLALGL